MIAIDIFLKDRSKTKILAVVFMSIYLMAILQDLLFARINLTGFYLSESGLFNVYWLLFVPGIWVSIRLNFSLLVRLVMPLLHSLVFTCLFVGISHLAYEDPHRFMRILNNVFANYLYLAILAYAVLPSLFRRREVNKIQEYRPSFVVKSGQENIQILTSEIQCIKTDKPYVCIFTGDGKYLDSRTIKSFIKMLDPKSFVQVNRSIIVNRTMVEKIVSRNNGDYDGFLSNGECFRLSRHYRSCWKDLLR